jgi:hypothetical protein
MASTSFILLVCSVFLLWIVALAIPLSHRESYSDSHGFTLKYKTYATMETQTESIDTPIDTPIDPMPFMPRVQNEPMPFFPDNSFETEEVTCSHGECTKEKVEPIVQPDIDPDVTPMPFLPRMMKPPRDDKRIEMDWFQHTDTDVVTLHDSNPFGI